MHRKSSKMNVFFAVASLCLMELVQCGTVVSDLLKYEIVDGLPKLIKESVPTLEQIIELCGDDQLCVEFNHDYARILNDTEYAKNFDVIDVTDGTPVRINSNSRQKRSLECPSVFNRAKSLRDGRVRSRSLSPWKMVINRDRRRSPEILPDSECLCQGCYSMTTLQLNENLASVRIPLNVPVKRLNARNRLVRSVALTHVGCRCDIPMF